MAWKVRQEALALRCPHCQKPIFLKVESKVKVAVRKPFRLAEGALPPKRKGEESELS